MRTRRDNAWRMDEGAGDELPVCEMQISLIPCPSFWTACALVDSLSLGFEAVVKRQNRMMFDASAREKIASQCLQQLWVAE